MQLKYHCQAVSNIIAAENCNAKKVWTTRREREREGSTEREQAADVDTIQSAVHQLRIYLLAKSSSE